MARTKTPTNKQKNKKEETGEEFEPQPGTPKESSSARRNREKLGQDESYIEIPEMKDIPGQEHIHRAGLPGEMADTTPASDDEEAVREGRDLLSSEQQEDDVDIVMGTEADVTEDDLVLLGDADEDQDMNEDELIRKPSLDNTDADGDLLNEAGSEETGDDLDIPEPEESEEDTDALDQGDEENDYYSLGGDQNDSNDNGTPNEYRDRGE